MKTILILLCLIIVVIVAYIILFAIIIKHIKEEIRERTEYFEQSRGQLFDEIQKLWNNGIQVLYAEISETKHCIEGFEVQNKLTPMTLKEEHRPIKNIASTMRLADFPYLLNADEETQEEYVKRTIEGQICDEIRQYIIYERESTGSAQSVRGSIDILLR